jgi:hypothetical protein
MNSLNKIFIAVFFTLILSFVYVLIPSPSIALKPLDDDALIHNSPSNQIASVKKQDQVLKPLDEEALDVLSPATTAPPPISREEYSAVVKAGYDSSVCFKKCHHSDDFSPSDKTRKQWQVLIEKNGHDIFKQIIWENPLQKEYVLIYLYENAKNPDFKAEGVGVWKP